MGRGPEAVETELVVAAFGVGGAVVCGELVGRLGGDDKSDVERAARTLKKIAEADGAVLSRWRKKLLAAAFEARDVRVQWNLSIVLGKMPLKGDDKALAVELMFERLRDKSGLNRTMAMQALMDLSADDAGLRARVMPVVEEFEANGTPAMKARARRLLGMGRTDARFANEKQVPRLRFGIENEERREPRQMRNTGVSPLRPQKRGLRSR